MATHQAGTTRRRTMSRRRSIAFIPVAVGALLGALGAVSVSAAPPTTDANEVLHWNQVAATTLSAFPPPNGGAAPALQINLGIVQGAVYDAVNAIGPEKHRNTCSRSVRCEGVGRRCRRHGRVRRALEPRLDRARASVRVRRPRGTPDATVDAASPRSLDAICQQGHQEAASRSARHAAACSTARVGDGRSVRPVGAEHRRRKVAADQPPTGRLDPTPWVGSVKPFFLQSSSQFRSVPPPALDRARSGAEFNEVKRPRPAVRQHDPD